MLAEGEGILLNRREMKKRVYRELAHFLNTRRQTWSSIPDWFANLELMVFRERDPTNAESDRLDSVLHEMIMEFFDRGGIRL